jgi:hypothetical protein
VVERTTARLDRSSLEMNNTEQIQNSQLDLFLSPGKRELFTHSGDVITNPSSIGVNYRASGNLLICREIGNECAFPYCKPKIRGSIVEFSNSSGCRMRRYLRECTTEYTQMVTLTYPEKFPASGATCKEHLRRFLQEMQREYNRTKASMGRADGHSAFWFMEFQERGAPHFHIFTNWSPNKAWVSYRWFDIVQSGDEKHLLAGTRTEFLRAGRRGTISYASKYAAKLAQKRVPIGFENIGRWWGVYGVRGTVSADVHVSNVRFKDIRVKKAVFSLRLELERLVFEKKARVIKRCEGFLLVDLLDKDTQQRILGEVYMIQATSGDIGDMFLDAEVEYGSCYSR